MVNSQEGNMIITTWLLLTAFVIFFYKFAKPCIRPKNFPPGPVNFPIVGALPWIGQYGDLLRMSKDCVKRYGDVFSFNLGSDRVVVVADYDLYKEIASVDSLCYRPSMGVQTEFFLPDQRGNYSGVMFTNGGEWQEVRRFTMKTLRDFGYGKATMEDLIREEVVKALDFLREEAGPHPVKLFRKVNVFIVNAMWHMITGESFAYDDPKLADLIAKVNRMMTSINQMGPLDLFPWLKYVAPDFFGYTAMKQGIGDVDAVADQQISQHELTFDPDHMRDYIDAYLLETRSCNPSPAFNGQRGRNQLRGTIKDLFVAGSDTTAHTLNWSIYYLAKYPTVADRLRDEVDSLLAGRMATLKDRPALPYVECFIDELQRHAGLAFLGIIRTATEDVTIGKFKVPKGTRVFPFIYHMMHDKSYWGEDADEFRPERFLDDHGRRVSMERNVPFGLGKRMCLGKTFAMTQLFLFVTAFAQHFTFRLPRPECAGLEPQVGFILGCPQYEVVIEARDR